MKVRYDSNNSGGNWWLKDEDWYALEKSGWRVDWCKDRDIQIGIRGDRFLGTLATAAEKEFETPREALIEFERITNQRVTDEGCDCCGAPHCFVFVAGDNREYASGIDLLSYLFENEGPKDLREAYDNLYRKDKTND